MSRTDDEVVLIDAAGHRLGSHLLSTIHTDHTPRHLAFSCWILDPRGRLLITRRSLDKLTWPGVWTNSCCGHPRPDEDLCVAVRRRVTEELGVRVTTLDCVLPRFSYSAVDVTGVVENEFCPVYVAALDDPAALNPDPSEVSDWVWQQPSSVVTAMEAAPYAFSPWSFQQLGLLKNSDHPSAASFGG
ncbi:MAG TPA: isopentenyl-diphosphate Delta-isomerase [Microlunatus sp.]